MDEAILLLSALGSLNVRTLMPTIECISADVLSRPPLMIWSSSTHLSTWTAYLTTEWHFLYSKSGWTDSQIILYWLQQYFKSIDRVTGKREAPNLDQ